MKRYQTKLIGVSRFHPSEDARLIRSVVVFQPYESIIAVPNGLWRRDFGLYLRVSDEIVSDSDDNLMGNRIVSNLKTDTVNYLGRMSSEAVTKCDKVDKLQALWQMSIASFPEEPVKSPYVNDRRERPASLNTNHYESPIKLRNTSVASNSENDLKITIQERPQSYIDMQGKKSSETEDLLVFGSMDDDKSDNNVTN